MFWWVFSEFDGSVDVGVSIDGGSGVLGLSFGIGMWAHVESVHCDVIGVSLGLALLGLAAALEVDVIFVIFGGVCTVCWEWRCGGVVFVGALGGCFSEHSNNYI